MDTANLEERLDVVIEKSTTDRVWVKTEKVKTDNYKVVRNTNVRNMNCSIPLSVAINSVKGDLLDEMDIPERWHKDGTYINERSLEPEEVLLETVEGQEVLELILYSFGIHWSHNTDIARDSIHYPEYETELGRWEVDESESLKDQIGMSANEITDKFLSMVNGGSSFVYTIELTDVSTGNVEYYVGRSSSPISRLRQHARHDGDFSGAEGCIVTDLYEVHTEEEGLSEAAQYERLSDEGKTVHGGK